MHKGKLCSLGLVLFGLLCAFYPMTASLVQNLDQKQQIASVRLESDSMDQEALDAMIQEAENWNARLVFSMETDSQGYEDLLSFGPSGIMSTLEIPKIQVKLPVYHGTQEEALSQGSGHMPNSSLPIGGKSSHAVLTAHRGLPTARLFTRLDELEKGDLFFLHTAGMDLAYEVFDIQVIEPENTDVLDIVPGQDLVTLVTCTPYGINSHRLLVTGRRTAYVQEEKEAIAPAMPGWRELFFTVLPVLLLAAVSVLLCRHGRIRRRTRV